MTEAVLPWSEAMWGPQRRSARNQRKSPQRGNPKTGLGYLVLQPDVNRQCQPTLYIVLFVIATGRIRRRGTAVGVQVERIEPWSQTPV